MYNTNVFEWDKGGGPACELIDNIRVSQYYNYARQESQFSFLVTTFNVTESTYRKCLYSIYIKAA